jgi:hypothetical protein
MALNYGSPYIWNPFWVNMVEELAEDIQDL